ncbi:hypothetical protein [Novipirellula sp.]|uniref:N-acyl amino acid synthase FeeM domain-containing protein n=1 Tax=Novipirellula sp. TaxID=2795430 RepID=UPI003562BB93
MSASTYRVIAAITKCQRQHVYDIRRTAFSQAGVELASTSGDDKYDADDNSTSYLLYQEDRPVGTLRASIYASELQWRRVPAMDFFMPAITQSFHNDDPMVQSSQFAILPPGRSKTWLPNASLFQILVDTASRYEAHWIISIIRDRPSQLKFYGRLGFRPISSPQWFPPVNRMCVLMCAPIDTFAQWTLQHRLRHQPPPPELLPGIS